MQTVKTYPCGLRLVHDYMPDRKVVNVTFFVASGSSCDLPNKDGIAHFYEHMFFKSTKKRTAYQINVELDKLGASCNACTMNDRTCYYGKVSNDSVEKLIDVLSDCFFNGQYLDNEMMTEKGVVCSEIDKYEDDFMDCCLNAHNEEMFKGTSFAHPILGTKESVMSITANDLREYREKNNCASNLMISSAGGVTFEEMDKLIQKYILPNYTGTAEPKSYANSERNIIKLEKHLLFNKKDTNQTYFLFGIPSVRCLDEKFIKLKLGALIFGSTVSSRLYQRMREKEGIVYEASSFMGSYPISGMFYICLIFNNENVKRAIVALKDEMQKVIEAGFTEDEIEQAKTLLKANLLIADDSVDSRTARNASSLLDKGVQYDEARTIQEIENLKRDDVNNAFKELLIDNNFLISIVSKEYNVDILDLLNK